MNRHLIEKLRNDLIKQQGMTLLEVLVATGILAVISSMAFLSLETLIQSKQSLDDANKGLNQFNLAQFQLQSDVEMAISSNQLNTSISTPEFIGNSQSITLLRYKSALVPNTRARKTSNQSTQNTLDNQRLVRVKWYLQDSQLIRASQSAARPESSLNSNQWQVRPMLDLKLMNCNYQNNTGQMNSVWPNSQSQNTQLPKMINCQIQLADGKESTLKMVPWQMAGWL